MNGMPEMPGRSMNTRRWTVGLLLLCLLLLAGNAMGWERVTYIHTDALGSVVAATDEDGNILWREGYQPYGKRLREEAGSNRPWYTGKYEEDVGLLYYRKRWYNPEIGRFYSVDPVRFDENNLHSFNRYAYANNNPYKFVDPDGTSVVTAIGGLLYESAQFLTGNGFNGRRVIGALKDGYDGEGEGFAQAAFDDVTTFVPVGAVAGILAKASRLAKAAGSVGNGANSATNALRLEKQLASQEQLGQLAEGGGTVISQPARQAKRIASQTGCNPENIQKVSSDVRVARDGQQIQTHSFRDASTNELIEPKTIIGN